MFLVKTTDFVLVVIKKVFDGSVALLIFDELSAVYCT